MGVNSDVSISGPAEFQAKLDKVRLEGFEVHQGSPTKLLLDLDTPADIAHYNHMLPVLQEKIEVMEEAQWRSKSGTGVHVALLLKEPLPFEERLLIQAALGSDRKRELLSLFQKKAGCEEPTVLFKPPAPLLESPTHDDYALVLTS